MAKKLVKDELVRYERREDIRQAFLDLGCALICWRYVQRLC